MSPKNLSKNRELENRTDSQDLLESLDAMDSIALSVSPLNARARLRENVLQSTGPGKRIMGYLDRVATFFDIGRSTTQALLEDTGDVWGVEWVDDEIAGVRFRPVAGGPRVAGAECALIHMPAGTNYPEHRHLGDEWCFFLGGNGLEAGHEWNPGDMILNPAGSDHAVLSAVSEEPFVLAVVIYEGIMFPTR